jgi:1-acyl-sn-glycerol-3-phosphate acyltransferase
LAASRRRALACDSRLNEEGKSLVGNARYRLAFLWVSQVARALADNTLRGFLLCALARTEGAASWPLVVALFMAPAVVLAPLVAAVNNGLSRRWVLAGSAAYCLLVLALLALRTELLVECCMLLAVGAAFYWPARSALLPAAAAEAGIPLSRLNAWMELGTGAAAISGMILGSYYFFYDPGQLSQTVVLYGVVGLLAALPAWFRGDVLRPESSRQALAGFFRDAGRVLRSRELRRLQVLMGGLRGLVAACAGILLAPALQAVLRPGGEGGLQDLTRIGLWLTGGLVLGSLVAAVQGHPRRALGLSAYGAAGVAIALVLAAPGGTLSNGWCLVLGATVALTNAPLAAGFQAALPPDARGNGLTLWSLTTQVLVTVLAGLGFVLLDREIVSMDLLPWLMAALAVLLAVLSWWFFFRETLEQLMELFIWPIYRIRVRGPGLHRLPHQGPLLLIANHTAWMDPVWLSKALPRRLTGMLTSNFYDLPGVGWIFRDVLKTIRVQASAFRREAPELDRAVEELDKGECVMMFPEGAMRRKAEMPLKMFGQGVWHILQQRPHIPVLVCWIEGGWGSYFSYWNGLPTKNKRMDFWRRIDVAVAPPQVIDPALLANHRATRLHLMQVCLETRRHLGLEPLKREQEADEEKERE